MSFCPKAQSPAKKAIKAQRIVKTSRTSGVRKPIAAKRTIIKTPAATIVAAWIRAETGVGPAMASASQTCKGNCALLPRKPHIIKSPIAVEAFEGSVWKILASSAKSVVPRDA